MSDPSTQVVVAAFDDEQAAKRALKRLDEQKKLMAVEAAALIYKDEAGQLHLKEINDMGGGRGATIGGAIGGALGLLGGPAGVVIGAGAGAFIGGFAAKVRDGGFQDERLAAFGQTLEPGTTFIVAALDQRQVEAVEQELVDAGAKTVSLALKDEVKQLFEEETPTVDSTESALAVLQNTDLSEFERITAVLYLKNNPSPEGIEALVAALEDDDQGVSWEAGTALASLGDVALKPLLKALAQPTNSARLRKGARHVLNNSNSPQVRQQTRELLGALKGPSAAGATQVAAHRLLRELN